MKKRILLFIIVIFIVGFLSGCEKKLYENEFFTYYIKKGNSGNYVAIYGLTELGKEQEILIIPENIDGIPVLDMGAEYGMIGTFYKGSFNSDKLKRVYILFEPYTFKHLNQFMFKECPNIEKIIYIKYEPIQGPTYNVQSFFSGKYMNNINKNSLFLIDDKILPANVSYLYNYEDAPNSGYYWVDDYNNELISFIPDDPTREGYIFKGWYKDLECAEIWDFHNDIIPEKITEYNSNFDRDSYMYKEIKIYAKWEINKI